MAKNLTNDQPSGIVLNFDHLVFWVGNAKTVSSYYVTRFGFKPLAVHEPNEDRPVMSYAVRLNRITIVFESPTTTNGDIVKDLTVHGDFVKDIAFEVQDLDELVKRAEDGGAEVVKGITEDHDDYGLVRYAVLKTYGDNTHTLIDRTKYKGIFLPGYQPLEDDPLNKVLPATNLEFIDHVEGNMADGTLESSVSWYEKNLNMQRFWCVDYGHNLEPYSCIKSASVINRSDTVLMQNLAARGVDILGVPPTYYDLIRDKLKKSSVKLAESIDVLQANHILIDFDERGYMLQAFTKHLQARPTLYIEILQRRNHRGFGARNYKWVFEAIERLEELKDLVKDKY